MRMIVIGTIVTALGVTLAAKPIFGLDWGTALVLGTILVVSGPTVVLPLLAYVRPTDRVRTVLKWEGVIIDPVGAVLGVLAFHAVKAGAGGGKPFHVGEFTLSLGVGLAVGALGAAVLWWLLRRVQREAPAQSVAAALLTLAAALVAADAIRDDSGFVAVTVMGVVMANQEEVDVSRILAFHGTVVELLIAILFVLISASVEPDRVADLLPEGLALVAVMVFVLRPLVVVLGTWGSDLSRAERAFMAWLAPRGIVAAATASAFGLQLTQAGVSGAEDILPIAFIVIFATVVLYGLTAAPVARFLGIAGAGGRVVLVVGGHAWGRALAKALESAGLGVRLWTGRPGEQAAAREAGLDAGSARLGVDLATREEELEEVSDALLVTESDDFNALAAYELRNELGHEHVYRLSPAGEVLDLVPPYAEGNILFRADLTYPELTRRFDAGAALVQVESADRLDTDDAPSHAVRGQRVGRADGGDQRAAACVRCGRQADLSHPHRVIPRERRAAMLCPWRPSRRFIWPRRASTDCGPLSPRARTWSSTR